jgi:ubiquinone/menaquinone biosynthesis C-methylase UbiE
VIGADIAPKMLAQAQTRAEAANITNVTWREAPAESLPFDDDAFDLVTCRIAPHHFADVSAFLREVRRVLAPGGVFVLGDTTVPDDDGEAAAWQNAVERERDPSHVANLSPATWRRLCEAASLACDGP